jgi:hypothetical protein
MNKQRLLELAGIKPTQLDEAAGMYAVPFDNDHEGDSSWGMGGFKLTNAPIQDQIVNYVKTEFGVNEDDEEFAEYLSELTGVWHVPGDVHEKIREAASLNPSGNDSAAYAQGALLKAVFSVFATKTEKFKYKKDKE